MSDPKIRTAVLIAASLILLVLMVSVFGLTSLNLPFIRPSGSAETILLFFLSTIIFLCLLTLGFILFRNFLKLYLERRANQLGSKFKTKMVCGAVGLSVLPVCFLFLFSYSLINRTLDKWFSRPFETVSREAHEIVQVLGEFVQSKAVADAEHLAVELSADLSPEDATAQIALRFQTLLQPQGLDYIALLDPGGKVLQERRFQEEFPAFALLFPEKTVPMGKEANSQLVEVAAGRYALGRAPIRKGQQEVGAILVGMTLPPRVSQAAARLNQESILYGQLSQERKFLRRIYLSILLLLTLFILFIATWFALFLSRQVTVPIQALAEATHEVSRGNLNYRIHARAGNELGILVQSFNEMTEQLAAGRAERERSRSHLEQVNRQLDQKNQFTEAILESIPTGVISISGKGEVLASNTAARRLFGRNPVAAGQLSDLFSHDELREVTYLMKRAARLGQATRQMEVKLNARTFNLAFTVAALQGDPPGSADGGAPSGWFVMVLEDMSDLLQAQKAAAWGEVAQRMAHEIKNPLTPIALSAERIHLWLERHREPDQESQELVRVLEESCSLIRQEVTNLKRLVDEFSQFARFPKACPAPANLNEIIEGALGLFNGRLDGIQIRTELTPDLPLVQVDAELFRRVFVNLIDNAAEAMESALVKELMITTCADRKRDLVEAVVADTGCGVSSEDKEKLFLPHFSTKDRGTVLGLAIVSRI
ncbi:MAG: HAMP domain-containing protein, partial [Acidobacteria bacterium]|nr:HAMP domain-containing protein [Acidobacteriota bacterium]